MHQATALVTTESGLAAGRRCMTTTGVCCDGLQQATSWSYLNFLVGYGPAHTLQGGAVVSSASALSSHDGYRPNVFAGEGVPGPGTPRKGSRGRSPKPRTEHYYQKSQARGRFWVRRRRRLKSRSKSMPTTSCHSSRSPPLSDLEKYVSRDGGNRKGGFIGTGICKQR